MTDPTPEQLERAQEIAQEMAEHFIGPGVTSADETCGACRGIIARALAAAKEEGRREAQEWQPIETAPKDDTIFLTHGEGRTFVAKGSILWHARRPDTPSHLSMAYVTHWMPLPAPPAKEQQTCE